MTDNRRISTLDNTAVPNLDARVILEPLDALLAALENKIEREWPTRFRGVLGAPQLVLVTLKTANVTYRSIRFLCADKPADTFRKPEYSISVPPLNRTILDNLFTLIFVFEDLPKRCEWYFKADWRESRLELNRYQAAYGADPNWQDWIGRLTAYCDSGISLLGLSPTEIAQPRKIPYWPNPGKMPNYGSNSTSVASPVRQFLRYLHDWFYADMSQQSHLGGSGLAKRAGVLLHPERAAERDAAFVKSKRANVGQTVALMLALATEIEVYFDFGLRERVNYVWGLATLGLAIAKELYDKRYAELLADT
jgi:hypothetical protein